MQTKHSSTPLGFWLVGLWSTIKTSTTTQLTLFHPLISSWCSKNHPTGLRYKPIKPGKRRGVKRFPTETAGSVVIFFAKKKVPKVSKRSKTKCIEKTGWGQTTFQVFLGKSHIYPQKKIGFFLGEKHSWGCWGCWDFCFFNWNWRTFDCPAFRDSCFNSRTLDLSVLPLLCTDHRFGACLDVNFRAGLPYTTWRKIRKSTKIQHKTL